MQKHHWLRFMGLVLLVLVWSLPALAFEQRISVEELTQLVGKTPQDGGYFLVDSRPEIKFVAGHIPYAVSIPWQEMKDLLDELPADKSTQLVFYCGGVKCDLSHKAADLAVAQGYQNVRVFVEGEPGWKKAGNSLWVSSNYIKMILNDRDRIALIIDARPDVKYNQGTIPGAINMTPEQFDKQKGLLPADKEIEIIAFCGGLKCDKSQKLAELAMPLGYGDIKIYAYGYPDWQKNSTRAFAMINPKEGGAVAAAPAEEMAYPGEIKQDELLELLKNKPAGFLLVDVRPADEFTKAHIPGAINILDETMAANLDKIQAGENVVFYCNTGSRAAVAFYAAEDAGFKKTRFLNKNVNFNADGSFEIN